MSVVVKRNDLTMEQVNTIRSLLYFQPTEKFNFSGKKGTISSSKPIFFYQVIESGGEQYVFLPYRFAAILFGKNLNAKLSYTPSQFKFTGILRDYQAEDVPVIIQQMEEHGTSTLKLYPSYGKCLAPGTKVLMFDGSKKNVEDIKIGEKLMGDDSKERNVLSVTSGEEEMFEISPVRGEVFVVNKSHILTLWASKQGQIVEYKTKHNEKVFRVLWFDGEKQRYAIFHSKDEATRFSLEKKSNCIFDIELTKYLKFKVGIKSILKCLYVPVFYPEQKVELDPYFIGIWLGNGNKKLPIIKTINKEIIQYLKRFAHENDVVIDHCKEDNYKLSGKKDGFNRVLDRMQGMNLVMNKHIPHIYKANSVEIRMKLLAGLIDSHGKRNKKCCYEIIQSSDKLSLDIQDLCRSLGFACFIKKYMKSSMYEGKKKTVIYNRICFSGYGTENIPVLIEDKKCKKKVKNRHPPVTEFTVKSLGVGKYHGFTIDGNGRFLLGSFMVTHNTIIGAYIAAHYGYLTVILMHRTTLLKQWQQTFQKVTDARTWVVGEESMPALFNVIICLDKRVEKIPIEIRHRVGMMIIDEAHAFCTESQVPRFLGFHPRYIISETATLERDDDMHRMIVAICGEHHIFREMKRKFYVYKIFTGIIGEREERKNGPGVVWHTLAKSLAFNPIRNKIIMELVTKNPTFKIVILTGYIDHAKLLYQMFVKIGESVDLLCGNKKNYRDSRILIGTINKIGTGFDEASFCDDFGGVKINLGILVHSIAKKQLLEQTVGRVFRADFPNIMHLVDDDKTIKNHWTKAKSWYKSKGGIIQEIDLHTENVS